MARTVRVELIDDLEGSAADETVRFGLDGQVYEIDLSAPHAAELRAAMRVYVEAGRRAGRAVAGPVGRRPRGSVAPSRVDRAQSQAIRQWARSKKIRLSDRGRIPADIVARYQAEAGRR